MKIKLTPPAAFVFVLLFAAPSSAAESDGWLGQDKALHFGATALLSSYSYGTSAIFTDNVWIRLGIGAGIAATASVGKEVWDVYNHGDPSYKDLTWDAIGTATGLLVAWSLDQFVIKKLIASQPQQE